MLVAASLAVLFSGGPKLGFAAEPWYMVTPHIQTPTSQRACSKILDPVHFPAFAQSSIFGIEHSRSPPGQIRWAVMTTAQLQRIRSSSQAGRVLEHELTNRETRLLSDELQAEADPVKVPKVVIAATGLIPRAGPFLAASLSFFNFIQTTPDQESVKRLAAVVVRGGRLRRFVEITHGDRPFLHDNIVLTVTLEQSEVSFLMCSARYALNVVPVSDVRLHAPMCGGGPAGDALPRLPSLGRHFDQMMDTLSRGSGYPEACRDRLLQDVGAAVGQGDPTERVRNSVATRIASAAGPLPRGSRALEDARQTTRLYGGERLASAVGGRGNGNSPLGDLAAGVVATSLLQRQIVAGATQLSEMGQVVSRGALAQLPLEGIGQVRASLERGNVAEAADFLIGAANASPGGEAARLLAVLGPTEGFRNDQLRNALGSIRPETLVPELLPRPSDVTMAVDAFSRLSRVFQDYGRTLSERTNRRTIIDSQGNESTIPSIFEKTASDLVAHQEEMAVLFQRVARDANIRASPQQIRFLADAAAGRLPVVQQLDAVRSGMLSFIDDVQGTARGSAIDRLQSLRSAAGQGMVMVQAAATLARGIDGVFPNLIDEQTSNAIANLEANVNTAQQVIGVFSALAVPGVGWMAALPAVTNLLGGGGIPGIGGGGSAPPLPPELSATLARIERSLAQINQKLDRVLELQQQTIERLEQMRLQMSRDRDMILERLDSLINLTQEGLELLRDPYRDWLKDCRTLLGASLSSEASRSFVTLSERQATMTTTTRTAINNCLNGLSAESLPGGGVAPGNGGFLAQLSISDMGTLHFRWPFLVLTLDEDPPIDPSQLSEDERRNGLARAGQRRVSGFYRMMSDYLLSTAAIPRSEISEPPVTPSLSTIDYHRCHARVLALLATAPQFMATIPAEDGWACPSQAVTVDAEGALPFAPWRASRSQDAEGQRDSQFEAWRLLEAHLNQERIAERAEIVIRGGEWRSIMEMDCVDPDNCNRRRILSRESAFGSGGERPSPGLWRFEAHDTLTEQMIDVVSIAIAREAMIAGGSLIPWTVRVAMAPLPEDQLASRHSALGYRGNMRTDPPLTASTPPRPSVTPAWDLLVAAQDHGDTLADRRAEAERRGITWNENATENKPIRDRLMEWNEARNLLSDPITIIDLLRVLGDDPFESPNGDHRLRPGVKPDTADLRTALVNEFRGTVFGADGRPGLSAITPEQLRTDVERLRTIAWLFMSPSGYDLPCRVREAEQEQAMREREPKPDSFRGATLVSRTKYLVRLRDRLAVPAIANRMAACLMGVNPLLTDNVVLRAVLERLNSVAASADWDRGSDVLRRYSDALAEEDGNLLRHRFLPGWPIERRGNTDSGHYWAVRVRLADGYLLRLRLPHAEELRRGEIASTPQLAALLRTRDRLQEHLVVYGGEDSEGGQVPLPLPGDAAARQVLAQGLALRRAEEQLRAIGGDGDVSARRLDRMARGSPSPN